MSRPAATAALLAFSFVLLPALAAHAKDDDPGHKGQGVARVLDGLYQVTGTNPAGPAYSGTVAVSRNGETYIVEWKIGAQTFRGTGIVTGKTLSVGYNGGIAVFTIETPKRVEGRWAPQGGTRMGREVWTR